MMGMVVLTFAGIDTADTVRKKLVGLNNLSQVVEVIRKDDGQVKIKEEPRLTGLGGTCLLLSICKGGLL
jgi:uncharacterized membrane protein